MLAALPTVAAADPPTPDPSLDVRPDPAPAQSQAPAQERATPTDDTARPTGRSPAVVVAGPTTVAKATPARSAPVRTSRRRTSAGARATRPHEREQRSGHASAIGTLRRLSPLLASSPFPRLAAGSTSSGGNTGAQFLLFAAVALLLLVAASASLIRLTTRVSADLRREPGR